MPDPVLARLAALKTAPIGDLKAKWRELFETEPPPYNRRFLEHRLAYRIQELAYGGLKPATVKRLRELAEDLDGGDPKRRQQRAKDRPVSGTRLVREYQGVEHCVTVRDDGYEYQGRPYQSLSAIARAITGTRWNGWAFFGLARGAGKASGNKSDSASAGWVPARSPAPASFRGIRPGSPPPSSLRTPRRAP